MKELSKKIGSLCKNLQKQFCLQLLAFLREGKKTSEVCIQMLSLYELQISNGFLLS